MAAAVRGKPAVYLTPETVDPWNAKVVRAGMGAHFRLPIVERSWSDIAAYTQGLHVYLADMDGDIAYDRADWSSPWALIIGSEAHGASADARALATTRDHSAWRSARRAARSARSRSRSAGV